MIPSGEYCLRENIDIIANFKGFSEQIFNIGFLIIAYFTIKRANNRGHCYPLIHSITYYLTIVFAQNLQEYEK